MLPRQTLLITQTMRLSGGKHIYCLVLLGRSCFHFSRRISSAASLSASLPKASQTPPLARLSQACPRQLSLHLLQHFKATPPCAGLFKPKIRRPSVFTGRSGCRKPLKPSKRPASLSKATLQAGPLHLLAARHHGHLFLRAFKAAVCPPSNPSNLPNPPNPPQAFPRQPSLSNLAPLGSQPPRPSVFKDVQGCRLPGLKPLKPSKPSASLSKATLQAGPLHLLAASHHGHLFLRWFKAAVCPPSNPSKATLSLKPCASWQPGTTAICF